MAATGPSATSSAGTLIAHISGTTATAPRAAPARSKA